MKKLTSLVFALALVAPASADSYVSVYGGANFGEEFSVGDWLTFDKETGSVIGGTVGTTIPALPGFRAELDVSFRTNDIGALLCKELALDGTDETTGVLANVVFDLPVGVFPVKPYVLAGVGFGHRTIEVRTPWLDSYSASESGLAWQVGAGAQYEVVDGVKIGVGYRYFNAPNIERSFFKTDVDAGGENHSVVATLAVDL